MLLRATSCFRIKPNNPISEGEQIPLPILPRLVVVPVPRVDFKSRTVAWPRMTNPAKQTIRRSLFSCSWTQSITWQQHRPVIFHELYDPGPGGREEYTSSVATHRYPYHANKWEDESGGVSPAPVSMVHYGGFPSPTLVDPGIRSFIDSRIYCCNS